MPTQSHPQSGNPQDNGGSGAEAPPTSIFGKPFDPLEEKTSSEVGVIAPPERQHSTPEMPTSLFEGPLDWEKIADTLPFGLIVFDSRQEVLFGNQTCIDLVGFDIFESDSVEDWLGKMCPDSGHREKVITSWRDHVWRKQSTRTYTLKSADGKTRDIEFRASIQADGGLVMMMQDVTLIRRTEDSVRLGKLKFRVLFSNLRDGVVLVDKSGIILDVNPAFLKLSEMPLSELRLTPLTQILHPEDAAALTKDEDELLSKEDLSQTDKLHRDVRLRTKSAEKRVRLSFCPVVSREGAYSMATYVFHDNEQKAFDKEAAKKVTDLAKKAQALLNAVPDLILLINRDKTIADFAPPAGSWKELPISDEWVGTEIGKSWPTLGELLDQTHERVFDKKQSINANIHSESVGDGDFVITLAPCGEDQAMAVVRNVTEVEDLKKSQLWHKTLFEISHDAVIRTEADGTVCELNAAAVELLGKPANELIGMKLSRFYSETSQLAEAFDQELAAKLSTKQGLVSDLTLFSPGGGEIEVTSHILPVENDGDIEALFNIISKKTAPIVEETPAEDNLIPRREKSQHQFRNQLQMLTSLFSLEPQNKASRAAALKWQVRLRSLAQSYPYNNDGNIWVVPMFRSIADEVSSLSGRGPGCREIIITGPESLAISPDIATTFCLLGGEIMRMVVSNSEDQPGPKLFLDLERCAHGEISLTVKPGASSQLFSPAQHAEAETLEILVQQLRGQLRATQNEENIGSLQIIFDGQVSL